MATMTTGHHSLSVLANSYVRSHVVSKVQSPPGGYNDYLSRDLDIANIKQEVSKPVTDQGTAEMTAQQQSMTSPDRYGEVWQNISRYNRCTKMDDTTEQLGNLLNDEFYQKLVQLKEEHKKTLKLCEKLYKQKLQLSDNSDNVLSQSLPLEHRHAHTYPDQLYSLQVNGYALGQQKPSSSYNYQAIASTEYPDPISHINDQSIETHDKVLDMSSKPPLNSSGYAVQRHKLTDSPLVHRPVSAPMSRDKTFHDQSFEDQETWHGPLEISSQLSGAVLCNSENDIENVIDCARNVNIEDYSFSSGLEHVQDMWDNFSIDDYAPRRSQNFSKTKFMERPSSANAADVKSKKVKEEWRHRITIPVPFKMTIRDYNKEKKKSRTQEDYEQFVADKDKTEEIENQKRFKATPVPANVYLPMFREIQEKNEARRRYVKQYSKELLKSMEKPFKFMQREEEKKVHKRSNSAPMIDTEDYIAGHFRANPVPSNLLDNDMSERLVEEEEYRRIRIKMRSHDLLSHASLPPSMEARKALKEQKTKEVQASKHRHSKYSKKKFVPTINREVPDYDHLYKQFQKELYRKKQEQVATEVKPFILHTSRIPSKHDRIMKDIAHDEELLNEIRWPYQSARASPRSYLAPGLSSSLDSIPYQVTNTAGIRKSQTRNRDAYLNQQEKDKFESDKQQRLKEQKMRKSIYEQTHLQEQQRPRTSVDDKVKEYKQSNRALANEYQRSLHEMRERVEKRPMLFEQVKQANAKKAMEKKFTQKLHGHGLSEEFLDHKTSRASSVRSGHERDQTSYKHVLDDTDMEVLVAVNKHNTNQNRINSDDDRTAQDSCGTDGMFEKTSSNYASMARLHHQDIGSNTRTLDNDDDDDDIEEDISKHDDDYDDDDDFEDTLSRSGPQKPDETFDIS